MTLAEPTPAATRSGRPTRLTHESRETTANASFSILVVEDEPDVANLICINLEREGYRCDCVSAGDAALERIRRRPPDLVLLDRMLPGLSGDELARTIKSDPATAGIPVIVVTAKTGEEDQLQGFAFGADDYITKPFSLKVLLARIAAVRRRARDIQAEEEAFAAGPIRLFPSRHEITVGGISVTLTAAEFRLLKALLKARGRVLTRSQLLDEVSGTMSAVTDRTIDVHVTALRRKLGQAAGWIQTVRGVGYTVRSPAPPVS